MNPTMTGLGLPSFVIPAQAGIQGKFTGYYRVALDSRLRGNDGNDGEGGVYGERV